MCVHETARRDETKGSAKEEGIMDSGRMLSNYGWLCVVKREDQPRLRSFGSKGIMDGPKM